MARRILLVCVFICELAIFETSAHTHHLHKANKEREADGARSPRDRGHYANGEHNTEFDHEAILGSVKEADEYDTLPASESKRRLEILLVKMDRNNDKHIDRTELHSWILRSLRLLAEEESSESLEEADSDEDGFVTWSEYINETYGINDPDDQELLDKSDREEEQKLLHEDRELFNAADKNIDGRLDEKEFLAFTYPEDNPDMLPILLRQTLGNKDTNKDGVIDFQEFIAEKGKDQNREWLLTEKDKFDHEYDLDKNGILDRNEIMAWAIPSIEDVAEDEVDHLFASSDDDGDDILSFLEILDHHNIFVGSEATDFGEHLHNLDRFEDEL